MHCSFATNYCNTFVITITYKTFPFLHATICPVIRDIEDPKSISISTCTLPTLPIMFAACVLTVATIIVLLGLTGMGGAYCPLQTSLCHFPAIIPF